MRYLRDPQVVLTILCGITLAVGLFQVHPIIPYLSVAFGSYFALKSAWDSLSERSIDVNLLMVLAAAGAVIVGEPLDAAALLFLFSLSSTLESLAMARTRSAIEELVKLRPANAVLILDGTETVVPVERLRVGDLIKIPPFEGIPVDSIVVSGQSSVEQSAMTGESVPVAKSVGEKLLGGTRNLEEVLIAKVASVVGDSTLDKIVALVEDAQENKASGERISTWFGKRYTVFVILVFAIALCLRLLIGETPSTALYASLTLLVALSPCALVISTPATTLSALAWAARNGILIRGGEFIEKVGHIDTIALDKTGTLTMGKPKLVEICVCSKVQDEGTCTDEEQCWHGEGQLSLSALTFLRYAAAAEQYASHPVAESIREKALEHHLAIPLASDEKVVPGKGVSAFVDGRKVVVGQVDFVESLGIEIVQPFLDHILQFHAKGMTVALVAVGNEVAALGFMDTPRPEATEFLSTVKKQGVNDIVVLSGDTEKTVQAIANQLGIDRHHGALLPGDKSKAIAELIKSGKHVMMVGDGVNDAPPLAAATVGVAMGGLGSDIAMNAADIVLVHDRLDRIPEMMKLGRRTNRIIRANFFFATGVIALLTALSLLGRLPLPLAVIGHEGSTVIVILNGLRVLKGP